MGVKDRFVLNHWVETRLYRLFLNESVRRDTRHSAWFFAFAFLRFRRLPIKNAIMQMMNGLGYRDVVDVFGRDTVLGRAAMCVLGYGDCEPDRVAGEILGCLEEEPGNYACFAALALMTQVPGYTLRLPRKMYDVLRGRWGWKIEYVVTGDAAFGETEYKDSPELWPIWDKPRVVIVDEETINGSGKSRKHRKKKRGGRRKRVSSEPPPDPYIMSGGGE